jgi:ribosomal protein S11
MKKKFFFNYPRKKTAPIYSYRSRYSKRRIFDFRNLNHKYFKSLTFAHFITPGTKLYPSRKFRSPFLFGFRRRFAEKFLYVSTRVGSYENNLKKTKKGKKIVSRFRHSIFPYLGVHSRQRLSRNKYFFKRRAISNFFKFNFSGVNSLVHKSSSSFFSSIKYRLHIRQTKNNLFIFLRNLSGRLIFSYTNGQTIYKGSKRSTPSAADLAGKQVSKFLIINKINNVCLVFDTPLTSIVKSAVRGLSTRLEFSGMLAYRFVCHNGIKVRATRRVLFFYTY